jgi:hypothetical protein
MKAPEADPLGCGEDTFEVRTQLADFVNSLLIFVGQAAHWLDLNVPMGWPSLLCAEKSIRCAPHPPLDKSSDTGSPGRRSRHQA